MAAGKPRIQCGRGALAVAGLMLLSGSAQAAEIGFPSSGALESCLETSVGKWMQAQAELQVNEDPAAQQDRLMPTLPRGPTRPSTDCRKQVGTGNKAAEDIFSALHVALARPRVRSRLQHPPSRPVGLTPVTLSRLTPHSRQVEAWSRLPGTCRGSSRLTGSEVQNLSEPAGRHADQALEDDAEAVLARDRPRLPPRRSTAGRRAAETALAACAARSGTDAATFASPA